MKKAIIIILVLAAIVGIALLVRKQLAKTKGAAERQQANTENKGGGAPAVNPSSTAKDEGRT